MPGFLACSFTDVATETGAIVMANTTAGVSIVALAAELISLVDKQEPALPNEWKPSEIAPKLLELTGTWFWGPTSHTVRVLPNGWLSISRTERKGRDSRFQPTEVTDVWIGLDDYYAGEKLHIVRNEDGTPEHLNVGTFIFTKNPYDPTAPIPGGLPEIGWR
jgi:hypothetical protein